MSEKRFAHWMMELITAAYEQAERSAPTMTCPSTSGVLSSWALLRGVLLQ